MLAMDMGTGKSRTAISLLDGWQAPAVIIVAPRSVVNVWPNQFAIHSERDWHAVPAPPKLTIPRRVDYLKKQAVLGLAKGQPVAMILNYESCWREPMAHSMKLKIKAATLFWPVNPRALRHRGADKILAMPPANN